MQDVSIVESRNGEKPMALIDPVCDAIQMDERVAIIRGLRGFGPQSQGFPKGPLIDREEHDSVQVARSTGKYFNRRRKIKESERQIADISISHDGEYAVASCMAYDPPGYSPEGRRTVDDGQGPAIHEPQWGDEGWFDPDYIAKDGGRRDKSVNDLLGAAELPVEKENYGNAL
jgi:hypothetical protein